LGPDALAPLTYFFIALAMAAFVVEAWAFIDAIIRPQAAFTAAGKLTKTKWLLITGVAAVLGFAGAMAGSVTGMLSVIAFVAAAVYLVDVRPAVRQIKRGASSGPYGPW
jgi:hypothetical protein